MSILKREKIELSKERKKGSSMLGKLCFVIE